LIFLLLVLSNKNGSDRSHYDTRFEIDSFAKGKADISTGFSEAAFFVQEKRKVAKRHTCKTDTNTLSKIQGRGGMNLLCQP